MDIPKINGTQAISQKQKRNYLKLSISRFSYRSRDARIPLSTGHPHLNKWINNKKHILVINRSDMISLNTINSWNKWFNAKDQYPLWCDAKRGIGLKKFVSQPKILGRQSTIEDSLEECELGQLEPLHLVFQT